MRLGSHHLARGFVRNGWDVAFVSPPVTPFHLISQRWDNIGFRVMNFLRGGMRDCDGHLWAYDPGALCVPKKRRGFDSDLVARFWMKTMLPPLVWMLRRQGFGKVDLIYFDTPILSFLLEEIEHERSTFRIADNYHGFDVFPDTVLGMLDALARKVDVVLYTAKNLLPYVESLQPKRACFFPNGVDFQHFAAGSRELPEEYRGLAGKKAVYVGAIEKWFDFELFNRTAEALPGVSFVVIGPKNEFSRGLGVKPNVHFLGPKPFGELPKYLHNADVGLIPFDVKNHRRLLDSVNPLKLYEYLACGLPVVATAWDELKRIGSPAFLCDDAEGFIAGIKTAISADLNKRELAGFAEKFDWMAKVRQLENEMFSQSF